MVDFYEGKGVRLDKLTKLDAVNKLLLSDAISIGQRKKQLAQSQIIKIIPDYPNAVHHIIPSNDPRALEARKILDHYDIDYNSVANGVFLALERNAYVVSEALHVGNHSAKYIEEVTNVLKAAKNSGLDKNGAVAALNSIRTKLLRGQLKLN